MGWYLTKEKGADYYVLETTITGRTLKEGTKKEVMAYMKRSLIRDANEAIADGGMLQKGGGISYSADKTPKKQNISIKTYVDSTIKPWFTDVEEY